MLKENPLSLFKVDSYKPLGIRLSFEDPTTPRERGGGGGVGGLQTLKKISPKYAIFSTVLSKIVAILMSDLTLPIFKKINSATKNSVWDIQGN